MKKLGATVENLDFVKWAWCQQPHLVAPHGMAMLGVEESISL